MRYLLACMLLCLSVGYSEGGTEQPAEITVTDETEGADVAAANTFANWGCGCGKTGKTK